MISLILTVKNEADALPRLLDSVLRQTRLPDEIVVADGGSRDRTKQVLEDYGERLRSREFRASTSRETALVVLDCPGANISQGRNAAIARSRGDIIACTDAGVRLDPRWLEEITRPFESANADVVSGFFLPDPRSTFETALAATTLPALEDIQPEKFLPSSRSMAFRRAGWEAVGGYPEWLDYSEDLIFDLALRAQGCRFVFAPQACVYFRPRSNLQQFARQYFFYARGDGKANLWFWRHMIRYFTYLVLLPWSITILPRSLISALFMWFFGGVVMFYTPYHRLAHLWHELNSRQKLASLAWVPVIRVTGDVAKMVGYPVGVWWRMKNDRGQPTADRRNEEISSQPSAVRRQSSN